MLSRFVLIPWYSVGSTKSLRKRMADPQSSGRRTAPQIGMAVEDDAEEGRKISRSCQFAVRQTPQTLGIDGLSRGTLTLSAQS